MPGEGPKLVVAPKFVTDSSAHFLGRSIRCPWDAGVFGFACLQIVVITSREH